MGPAGQILATAISGSEYPGLAGAAGERCQIFLHFPCPQSNPSLHTPPNYLLKLCFWFMARRML